MPEWLAGYNSPDVVLLGSSLTLVAAARADLALYKRRQRTDPWWYDEIVANYTHADFLQKQLEENTGLPLTVANLSVSGAMVSDDLYVLHLIKRKDWKPKYVICCVAPRDFISNDGYAGPDTTLFNALRIMRHQYPELALIKTKELAKPALAVASFRQYWSVRQRNARAAWDHLVQIVSEHKKWEPLIAVVDGFFFPFYEPHPNQLAGIEQYRTRYNPPNYKLFEQQSKYFEALLAYCAKEKISIGIVDMPLPQENLKMIDPTLLSLYKEGLKQSCRKFAVPLVDLQARDHYSLDRFEDVCHLNEQGGMCAFSRMARELAPQVRRQSELCQLTEKNGL